MPELLLADRRSLRGFLVVLLLALLGRDPARAQSLVSDDGWVRAEVTDTWPALLDRGAFPLGVDLRNVSQRTQSVRFTVDVSPYWGVSHQLVRSVELGPGEERRLELVVPCGGFHAGNQPRVMASLSNGGRASYHSLRGGNSSFVNGNSSLLLASQEQLAQSERVALGERLLDGTPLGSMLPDQEVFVGQARFDQLPSSWEAYTSLDALCLDLSRGTPDAEVLGAMADWLRTGGHMVVVGSGAAAKLAAGEAFRGALEERFLRADGGRRFGLGTFWLVEGEPTWAVGAPEVLAVATALQAGRSGGSDPGRIPDPTAWRGQGNPLLIPGLGSLPLENFVALLLLFALLIGPVNLWVLARLKRTQWFLLTVPALSLLASLLVLGVGLLSVGLSVRVASRNLVVLDQRTHRAAVLEDRVVFAGLSPGRGLRPAAGSVVFPQVGDMDGEEAFEVQQDDQGRLLTGDYVRVRDITRQVVVSSTAARGRLRFAPDGKDWQVTNELPGVGVERVLLCAPDGSFWAADNGVGAGARADLERLTEPQVAARLQRLAETRGFLGGLELVSGTYLAELAENPWRDDTGLEAERLVTECSLLGVLDLEEGR